MTMTTPGIPTQLCAPLRDLVTGVRAVVAEGLPEQQTADRVAALLAPALRHPGLLQEHQCHGDKACYTQHILHVEPDGSFSIVALVWLPGQTTPVHDHVSWCTVGVYQGQETETLYRVDGEGDDLRLAVRGGGVNPQGSVTGIAPPGDIHAVSNSGGETAISLHVYGADIAKLGSSIRRTYDLAHA
jgi:predicted metal-dependent enzyme (double-stranded beta helix superfamily)